MGGGCICEQLDDVDANTAISMAHIWHDRANRRGCYGCRDKVVHNE